RSAYPYRLARAAMAGRSAADEADVVGRGLAAQLEVAGHRLLGRVAAAAPDHEQSREHGHEHQRGPEHHRRQAYASSKLDGEPDQEGVIADRHRLVAAEPVEPRELPLAEDVRVIDAGQPVEIGGGGALDEVEPQHQPEVDLPAPAAPAALLAGGVGHQLAALLLDPKAVGDAAAG